MEREIKFRYWQKESKEMSKGFLLQETCGKENWDVLIAMQFTGLKDKNGKEIYEGDILKSEDYYKGEVIMGSHNTDYPGSWIVKTYRTNNPGNPVGYVLISDYCEDECKYVEVIGNIYEVKKVI